MIQHHPGPEILTRYAGGALNRGAMLAVACHIETCVLCRQEVALWESAGGALLAEAEAAPLSESALERMMARLDEPQVAPPTVPGFLQRFDIPEPLKGMKIGHRRFVTPNIWFAPLDLADGAARTYLVYARANTMLAEHSHTGREFTQVLHGAFRDGSGVYGAGDFAATDDSVTHAPGVTENSECLCLISSDAPMRLKSFPARLIQAVTGTLY